MVEGCLRRNDSCSCRGLSLRDEAVDVVCYGVYGASKTYLWM